MVENSAIEWCDHTFNPWEGCQKVSPGCDHCYAEARNQRFGGGIATNWGPGAPRRKTSLANWFKPRRWQREAKAFFSANGRRQRVFCSSLADVFDNAVDPLWRAELWELIRDTPDLDWLLLTKRPQNIQKMLPPFWDEICAHVWFGTSTEDQTEADRRIIHLTAVTPRPAVFFLSIEPALGPITFRWASWQPIRSKFHTNHLDGLRQLDWIIMGGESGTDARPMHPDWVRAIRDQCKEAEVPFLFKQWGAWAPGMWLDNGDTAMFAADDAAITVPDMSDHDRWNRRVHWFDEAPDGPGAIFLGKHHTGRLLDGVIHNEFPKVSQ